MTYAAALNHRDTDALRGVIASDVVGHEPAREVVGLDAFKANIEAWLRATPTCGGCKELTGPPAAASRSRDHHLPRTSRSHRRVLGPL
jgi:hypothetical protein